VPDGDELVGEREECPETADDQDRRSHALDDVDDVGATSSAVISP
jgi:hypothetical protein